jgi:cytochrome c oxidase subunit 4
MADHNEHSAGGTHIVPLPIYFAVFGALLVGTGLTVWAATVDLGRFNIVLALLIACVKASLVVLFFMHIYYSSKMTKTVLVAGFATLLIMFFFTSADLIASGWFNGNPWIGVPGR